MSVSLVGGAGAPLEPLAGWIRAGSRSSAADA